MPSHVAAHWAGWQRFALRNLAGPLAGASVPTLSLIFDSLLSRVRIQAFSLGSLSTYAVVDRSTNGVTWAAVRGGAAIALAADQSMPLPLDDYEWPIGGVTYRVRSYNVNDGLEETVTGSITTTLIDVWLKSVARPFLNLTVSLLGATFSYERAPRGGTFPIVGRSLPVAVTDVRGSRQYALKVRTDTDEAGTDLDLLLASGDVLFLHVPSGSVVPSGGVFVMAGQVVVDFPTTFLSLRFTNITLVEVAAPGPDVVGATSSWQTVISTYADWASVLAAHATWADLLELVGDPSEVIVP